MLSAQIVPLLLLVIISFCNFCNGVPEHDLQTAKQWNLINWNFLPHAPVNDVNFYNPSNVVATGIAISHDRIFLATPKLFSGVPATVSFMMKTDFEESPLLQPYPDWSYSISGRTDFNCSDLILISVYRMRIDSCNRLWVLDAGVSRSLEDFEVTCPPKILIFDLNTNQVLRRVDFPNEILRGESLFTNLVIDETTSRGANCDDVFVYISDTVEPALIVYDSERDVTWRLTHPAMFPDPDFAQSEILNDRFILMDGVVGLTFDKKTSLVYFQPLATDRVFSISKEVLRAGPIPRNQVLQVKLVGKKSSQGIGMAISPIDDSLIFSPITETAIATWNPTTNTHSILAFDQDRLQFVADISTTSSESNVIYAVSSKFQRYFLKNINPNEANCRILRIDLTPNTHSTSYAYKPRLSSVSALSRFYHINSVDKFKSDYLDSPFKVASSSPFDFEPVGLLQYSSRNPFTALNQGEAFPPTRAARSNSEISFLDNLNSLPMVGTTITSQTYHPGHALSEERIRKRPVRS
ncbi:major royal jelly protein 1-like [Teleopsis dalmanni]|uniref:major royal jelly protein 1-like n=1 Tax=Teleopsis dalmanni TaxID=139649 RepID=UPI0018CEF384|nr:major royal jelly protein 1-like [Teleopsis dalmanni]